MTNTPPKTTKKPYSSPKLTVHGSITMLTQNGSGSGVDGNPVGGMRMMCL